MTIPGPLPYSRHAMARERAKSFEERLPDVVPREEADISQLSDEILAQGGPA